MLTGQRLNEVSRMRWAEIDIDAHVWTIPRERTKNDVAHNVPLSSQSLAILHALPVIPSDTGLVFTTTGYSSVGGFSRAKTCIDGAIARARPSSEPLLRWTFHDLRRTVASGMARLRIDIHVVEKVLNHSSGSFAGIVGVYQRHTFAEEKRELSKLGGTSCNSSLELSQRRSLISITSSKGTRTTSNGVRGCREKSPTARRMECANTDRENFFY